MENTHKLAIGVGGSVVLITILLLSISSPNSGVLFVENSKLDFKNESLNGVDYLISLKDVAQIYPTHTDHFYLLLVQNNKQSTTIANLKKELIFTDGPMISDAELYLVHNLSMLDSGFLVQYHKVDKLEIPSQHASWYLIKLKTPSYQKGNFNITLGDATLDPEISACGTINSPGFYNLTSGIANATNCFLISTSNVTFDCQNVLIDGNGTSSGYAFSVSNQTNISLVNCPITQFQNPVQLTNTNASVQNLVLINNTNSVQVLSSSNISFSNLTVLNQTNFFYSNSSINSSISNFVFGFNGSSRLSYSSLNLANLNLSNNSNLIISSDFVSINSSGLPQLNSSATVYLESTNCTNKNIMVKTGYPISSADIRANGTFTAKYANCGNGIANFTVTSFSGYALNFSNFNLTFTDPSGSLNFTAAAAYHYNVTPNYQSIKNASINITNNLNSTIWNITVYFNQTPSLNGTLNIYSFNSAYRPPNTTQNWSNTGNGIVTIPFLMTNNSSTVVIRRIRANESIGLWFWADFINVTDNQTKSLDILIGGGNT